MSLNWNGKKPVVDCSKDKGFTVQADRDEADINKIIARFERTGAIDRFNNGEPFYGDVSEFDDLAGSIRKVNEANDLFMGLDAHIRERFSNDPVEFVEFLGDDKNREEAIELGIVSRPPITPVPPVPASGTSPAPEPGK